MIKNKLHIKNSKIYFAIAGLLFVLWLYFLSEIPEIPGIKKEETFIIFVISLSFFIPMLLLTFKLVLLSDNISTNQSSVTDSVLKFYFLLPIKRKTIAFWGFVFDIILSILYCFTFCLSVMIVTFLHRNVIKFNIFLCFVSPLSTTLFLVSLFLLFSSYPYFAKSQTLKFLSVLFAYVLLLPLPVIGIIGTLTLVKDRSTIVKYFVMFIMNLYNNSIWSSIYLLISIILFITSYIVVSASFYRREV